MRGQLVSLKTCSSILLSLFDLYMISQSLLCSLCNMQQETECVWAVTMLRKDVSNSSHDHLDLPDPVCL